MRNFRVSNPRIKEETDKLAEAEQKSCDKAQIRKRNIVIVQHPGTLTQLKTYAERSKLSKGKMIEISGKIVSYTEKVQFSKSWCYPRKKVPHRWTKKDLTSGKIVSSIDMVQFNKS